MVKQYPAKLHSGTSWRVPQVTIQCTPLDKAYSYYNAYYISLKQTQKYKHNHEKSSFVSIAAVK